MTRKKLLIVDDELYGDLTQEVRALRQAFDLLEATTLYEAVELLTKERDRIDGALFDIWIQTVEPREIARIMVEHGIAGEARGYALALFAQQMIRRSEFKMAMITQYRHRAGPPFGLEGIAHIDKYSAETFGKRLVEVVLEKFGWSAE